MSKRTTGTKGKAKTAVAAKRKAKTDASVAPGKPTTVRVLYGAPKVRRVIESLCPGCAANETIIERLVSENAARAQHEGIDSASASDTETRRAQAQPCNSPGCTERRAREAQYPTTDPPRGAAVIDKTLIDRTPPTVAAVMRRIWLYLKARYSGPAAYAVVKLRRSTCVDCASLEQVGDGLFCAACGCGHRRDANLEVKTRMRRAECPLGKWPTETKP